ncbi:MAG: hypothetical protein PVI06_04690 [Desulfobacterales bacterium]|jgi:hypothetical protein
MLKSKKINKALIKAHLNLYALLPNCEDLVQCDREIAELSKNWDFCVQFIVRGGLRAYVDFQKGLCKVGKGTYNHPTMKLFFTSPRHLNEMFDRKTNPIPLKGFTRLGFLKKEFSKLTDRLEYYLKPTEDLLKDQSYLEINTHLMMKTAAFAVKELSVLDPIGKIVAPHIPPGVVLLKILPHGPSVSLDFKKDDITVKKGGAQRPMACMFMKNVRVANDFLSGKMDAFTAVASGDVSIRGKIPMLDSIGLILDRIPLYLS